MKYNHKHPSLLFLSLAIILLQVPVQFLPAQEQENPMLCVGHYQTEEEAEQQLKRFSESYNNLKEWEKRAG
ncbi:MAG: hypothetical protein KAI95_09865, partial [Bacteroidales bacterium]|nr:hypothetical protein [Bacteroidales bacterium]